MRLKQKWVSLNTIIFFEASRTFRLWRQTLLPPVITTVLYFVIFGHVIGSQIGSMQNYPYIQFIAPGLIMMQVILSSFSGSVSSFFMAKFHRNIEEILVSPMSNILILLGYMTGGVLRGLMIGTIITVVTLIFTHLHVYSVGLIFLSALLTASIFSLAGVINAVYAKTFDDISIIPTFVLTPLTYLGGVFYSITLLSPFWQKLSSINPIIYMVTTFRYGFLHLSAHNILIAYLLMFFLLIGLFVWANYLFKNAAGLRH